MEQWDLLQISNSFYPLFKYLLKAYTLRSEIYV